MFVWYSLCRRLNYCIFMRCRLQYSLCSFGCLVAVAVDSDAIVVCARRRRRSFASVLPYWYRGEPFWLPIVGRFTAVHREKSIPARLISSFRRRPIRMTIEIDFCHLANDGVPRSFGLTTEAQLFRNLKINICPPKHTSTHTETLTHGPERQSQSDCIKLNGSGMRMSIFVFIPKCRNTNK